MNKAESLSFSDSSSSDLLSSVQQLFFSVPLSVSGTLLLQQSSVPAIKSWSKLFFPPLHAVNSIRISLISKTAVRILFIFLRICDSAWIAFPFFCNDYKKRKLFKRLRKQIPVFFVLYAAISPFWTYDIGGCSILFAASYTCCCTYTYFAVRSGLFSSWSLSSFISAEIIIAQAKRFVQYHIGIMGYSFVV